MLLHRMFRRSPMIVLLGVALFSSWNNVLAQTASSTASLQHTTLHSFGGSDGAKPVYAVIAGDAGSLYGTTIMGGKYGGGNIFKLTPQGSGYKETVLYNFTGGADGYGPWGLVADKDGALYGGTLAGATGNCYAGCGTLYKLTPGKSGYTFTLLHSFQGPPNDAGEMASPLVFDKVGNLYGSGQQGAIFKLTRGKSGYTYSLIYTAEISPFGLAIDSHGALYGTGGGGTGQCGNEPCGQVFKLTPTKSGYALRTLYSFRDYTDANDPVAPLTLDESTGAIYGTSQYGGSTDNGTVFKLTPSGSGYTEEILYDFSKKPTLAAPMASVLLGPNGVLYGTAARQGGGCGGIGCGGVFKLTPSGSGYSFEIIYRFVVPLNGDDPEYNGLISDGSGTLYGATPFGGSQTDCYDGGPAQTKGCGTVYKLVLK
jgi:uncharacterized repeat protein (TIGR03803 family)